MAYRRKNVGVLLSILDSFYQAELWKGLREEADREDNNLLFFSGMPLLSPMRHEDQENMIYSLVNPGKLDGIVVESGTISNYISKEQFSGYVDGLGDIPLVTISVELENRRSVILNNKESMEMLINHLIEHHGYSKIAFVTGPMNNEEAEFRYNGYISALKKHHIEVDDNLVFEGDFTQRSGNAAVNEFYKTRKVVPEVIAFSNDEMAIGGIVQLEVLGFSVPGDVKVTGFDDIEDAKGFTVPLTTIRQPFYDMGIAALKKVISLTEDIEVENKETLKGEMVIRESCGCYELIPKVDRIHRQFYELFDINKTYDFDDLVTVIEHYRYEIIDIFIALVNGHHHKGLFEPQFDFLTTALIADIRKKKVEGIFLHEFKKLVKKSILLGENDLDWHRFIFLFIYMHEQINMTTELLQFIQQVTQIASVMSSEMAEKNELQRDFDYKILYYRISHLIHEMSDIKNKEELIELVKVTVEENLFTRFYLCFFDEVINAKGTNPIEYPDQVSLVFGHEYGETIDTVRFATKDMLPDYILYKDKRSDLAFFPLYYKENHYGYVCADINTVRNTTFKSLREMVGNTLSRIELFNALEEKDTEIRQLKSRR